MAELFIDKIRKTILNHLRNEKFGVGELASEMGLSRSQVLRKVKAATGKSVNQLIREIRLKEAVKLLKQSDLTASEIAYQVGFSSPSYFNKCFLDHFGVTPGEYKKNREPEELVEISASGLKTRLWHRKSFVTVLLFFIVILALYFLVIPGNKSTGQSNVSIAVLPLSDYSENKDKEYLADGLTEAINLELAKNESLRVISRGSAMKYKGSKELYSEIAKELSADLLLEGSLFCTDDSLSVVVQLIEPFPKERHLWQNNYDQDYSNALNLVRTVSNEIAEEISSVVEPNKNDERSYKVHPEAFDLYLRGRHLCNTQKTRYNSLTKAVEYLDEAIAKDPGFALAYVTLAECYLGINFLISDNEEKFVNRDNARRAMDKALDLDKNLAEVYITKANLSGKFDWDWEKMKKLAEKGLELEPSNANAHVTLSNYYVVKGNYRKAINEALKAEALDPLNFSTKCLVAERYYIAEEFDKSIDKYNEVIELDPDYGLAYNGIGYAYFKAGYQDKAVESWQKLQLIMRNTDLYQCYNDSSFEDCLHFFLDNAKKGIQPYCSNPSIISSIFMMVNEEQGALEYLNVALHSKNEDLPIMITYPDFYSLHGNPEFNELAQKIGVIFPAKDIQ